MVFCYSNPSRLRHPCKKIMVGVVIQLADTISIVNLFFLIFFFFFEREDECEHGLGRGRGRESKRERGDLKQAS